MSVVGDWVKSIVFVLVLASVMEMLLPRGSLHRFVQVVLGLMIIMSLLQPMLELLSRQTFFERRLAALGSDLKQANNVPRIIARGGDLAEQNRRLVSAEFRRRAAAISEEYALTVAGVKEAKAEVETVMTDVFGKQEAEISELRLRVWAGRFPAGAGDGPVVPVRTVTVGPAANPAAPSAASLPEAEKDRIRAELLRTFHNFYGLSPEKIVIEIN